MRSEFENFLKEYTGRDWDYHQRNKTSGLKFAWECWKKATSIAQDREPCTWIAQGAYGHMVSDSAPKGPVEHCPNPKDTRGLVPLYDRA